MSATNKKAQLHLAQLTGPIPALITPFSCGEVDDNAFTRLLKNVYSAGIEAVAVAGSTGEGVLLKREEYKHLIQLAKAHAPQSGLVIAGVCHPSSTSAAAQAVDAEDAGADILLVTMPPYLHPNDQGVMLHYETVAHRTKLPLLLYNIPSRTGINASIDVISHLASNGIIVGIKESAVNLSRAPKLVEAVPEGFALLCGDDYATPEMYQYGFQGTVSVIANLYPGKVKEIHQALANRETEKAKTLHEELSGIRSALSREPNPQGIKYALRIQGICDDEVRPPLVRCSPENSKTIEIELSRISTQDEEK